MKITLKHYLATGAVLLSFGIGSILGYAYYTSRQQTRVTRLLQEQRPEHLRRGIIRYEIDYNFDGLTDVILKNKEAGTIVLYQKQRDGDIKSVPVSAELKSRLEAMIEDYETYKPFMSGDYTQVKANF